MLRKRVVSAAVLIPAVICAVWFSPYWLYTALFGLVMLAALYEFYNVVRTAGIDPRLPEGMVAAAVLIAFAYFSSHPRLNPSVDIIPVTGAVLALAGLAVNCLQSRIGRWAAARWVWTIAGVVYVGWLGSHFIALRSMGGWDTGRRWIILALFATFASDTVAYFVGRAFGRHKMAPAISPGKTWEGAAGGFVGGVAATVLLAFILKPTSSIDWKIILLGCLIPVAAVMGDLAESKFKRMFGVKDAGSIIPGHGGLLDRLDSILLVVVVVYYYVLWVLWVT